MNKENSQLKIQECPSRTEEAEWHTVSKLEESKCHCGTPDGLGNVLNGSLLRSHWGSGYGGSNSTEAVGYTLLLKKLQVLLLLRFLDIEKETFHSLNPKVKRVRPLHRPCCQEACYPNSL